MSIGQVMLDIGGLSLTAEDRELLQHPKVGGVILFHRNFEQLRQLRELTAEIKTINPDFIIAVDQEGGRVQRFTDGFSRLAPLGDLGSLYAENPTQAENLARIHARTMASELLAAGVDLSFTPVLDRNIGVSSVIGDRSFHADPYVITELGRAYITAMHEAGMPATGKHFPGHGAVVADSHFDLPIDTRDFTTIAETDLLPFTKLAHLLDAVMIAHVVYQQVSDLPAGFDAFWLRDILRQRCGFTGVIFSDCLSMAATQAFGSFSERADLALSAGCDMVLVCNDRSGAIDVLEQSRHAIDSLAVQRLMKLCYRNSRVTQPA